uniref:Transposase Tc1-like domain-containing protein n=1 Tax=Ditylenchus dipsaci TaxID=166011 RepID=A0A915DL90_9BILA
MSRNKNLSAEQRQKIVRLRAEGESSRNSRPRQIFIHRCSPAIKHVKSTGNVANKKRIRRRKTSKRMDRIMHRITESDRHETAVDVHKEIADQLEVPIGTRTVQSRLNEFGLMGRVARKKPLISEKNRKKRLAYANEHLNWTMEHVGL